VAVDDNGPGDVRIIQYGSLPDEARGIAKIVSKFVNDGYQPQDILILAQRRVIGDPIHKELLARDIPSKSYYHEGDLARIEAQDRFAILKLVLNQEDRIALRWLLGYGSNDFRSGAYCRIRQRCEDTGETPWNVLAQLDEGTIGIPHTRQLVERFRAIRAEVLSLRSMPTMEEFVTAWLRSDVPQLSDFRALVASVGVGASTRKELFDSLVTAIATPEVPPDVTEVRIMSLHKSKGLSSPVVIIAGCVEGLLPARPDESLPISAQEAELEEQRRLFYVGLTRVKAQPATNRHGTLILTSSRTMTLADAMGSGIAPASVSYGIVTLHASRFIRELGQTAPATTCG